MVKVWHTHGKWIHGTSRRHDNDNDLNQVFFFFFFFVYTQIQEGLLDKWSFVIGWKSSVLRISAEATWSFAHTAEAGHSTEIQGVFMLIGFEPRGYATGLA